MIYRKDRNGNELSMLGFGCMRFTKKESGRGWSPAEWAFRWLYNQPEVTVVLSGMNSMEMAEENCRTASEAQPGHLTESDFEVLEKVKK